MGHREIISTPEVRQVGMMGVRKKLLTRSLKPQTSNRGFRDKRSVTHCSCSTFYFKKIIEQDKLSCTGKKLCVSMLINQMVLLDLFCRTIPPPIQTQNVMSYLSLSPQKLCPTHPSLTSCLRTTKGTARPVTSGMLFMETVLCTLFSKLSGKSHVFLQGVLFHQFQKQIKITKYPKSDDQQEF